MFDQKIKVVGGDFPKSGLVCRSAVDDKRFKMSLGVITRLEEHKNYSWDQVADFQVITEDNSKKVAGAMGWAAAGGLALGPIGLIGGLLLGGNKGLVTFACKFTDDKKFVGTMSRKSHGKLAPQIFEV